MAGLEALLAAPLHQVALVNTTDADELPAIPGVSAGERMTVYTVHQVLPIPPLRPARHTGVGEEHVVERVTAVLLRVASELLHVKIEDLDVHGDLYECGFDPVSLASLIDQLNREYALDEVARRAGVRPLTPTLLVEHQNGQPPTLSGLAQFLATESCFGVCLPNLA